MEIVLVTGETLPKGEGAILLKALVDVITAKGYTIISSEIQEIDISEIKIGDANLVQEHFYESRIVRRPAKKSAGCSGGECAC